MSAMFEATVSEFPFVAELPKRDRSKVRDIWQGFREFSKSSEERGGPVPVTLAAKLLGISRQRIWVLMEEGKLERLTFEGHAFVSGDSIVAMAKAERKAGRPVKAAGLREVWNESMAGAKELLK